MSKSVSGPARSQIASLRQYGLLEADKNGNLRVSSRALTLALRAETSSDHADALKEAALTPPLFREIHEQMGEASDDALVHHLVSARKFAVDGARRLVRSYRATLEVAKISEPVYD